MISRKKVIPLTIVLAALVIAGWVFNLISLYFILPILAFYTLINVLGSINIQWNYFINSLNSKNTDEKIIALTFDDGPDPEVTPILLDVLKKHNSVATFFCIGQKVNNYKEIVQSITKYGHIIGNHTYYHSHYFDLLSATRMRKEIDLTNNDIYKITGLRPKLFRPPYGVTNPSLAKALKRTMMTSIGWSLRSLDTVKSKDQVMEKLKQNTKSGDVVLFHDTRKYTPELIDEYIGWLDQNGYKIVSLNQLFNIKVYED